MHTKWSQQNQIGNHEKKKRLVWFTGEFMREHVADAQQLDLYSIFNQDKS